MMRTYYITAPGLNIDAKVTAPSTEKARTEFLDFLERTGRIHRRDRQTLRRVMATQRLENPYEVSADVELSYVDRGSLAYLPEFADSSYSEEFMLKPFGEVETLEEEPLPIPQGVKYSTKPFLPVKNPLTPIEEVVFGQFFDIEMQR